MLTTIERHMAALIKRFPKALVADHTAAHLTAYFRRGKHCLKTYNNRRGLVSTFLKFAEQQEWLATNPMKKVPYHRIARRRGSAKTLSADEAQKLMTHVESFQNGRLVPFFALCLFGGIRPCLRTGEILRVKLEHVLLDTGVFRIEPEVSKIKELRTVAIQPNLAARLRAYPLKKFPIIIPNLQKYRAKIAKTFGLSHDVMRHTFISMFRGKIPLHRGSVPASGQFREHHQKALPRFAECNGSRAVLRHHAEESGRSVCGPRNRRLGCGRVTVDAHASAWTQMHLLSLKANSRTSSGCAPVGSSLRGKSPRFARSGNGPNCAGFPVTASATSSISIRWRSLRTSGQN